MQFSMKIFGYRKDQVDKYIDEITKDYEKRLQFIQIEIDNLTGINQQLRGEVSNLKLNVSKYQESEKTLSDVLLQAQMKAVNIETEAKKLVAEKFEAVMNEIKQKKNELQELQLYYKQAKEEFRQLVSKYRLILEDSDNSQPIKKEQMTIVKTSGQN